MEYNTSRNMLHMPEYGRNIQKMVEYTCSVEDREERNRLAQSIVTIMGVMNPHLRDVTDFKHKLWDHLFIISDFKLDVDSPYPKPEAETFKLKPDRINYPKNDIRWRHYGKSVENLVKKITEMEAGEEREQIIRNTANFMKYLYVTYNKDSVVDEVIFDNLTKLSNGAITLPEDLKLSEFEAPVVNLKNPKKQNGKQKKRLRKNKK